MLDPSTPRAVSVRCLIASAVCFPVALLPSQNDGSDPKLVAETQPAAMVMSGKSQPALSGVEQVMIEFMNRHKLPGGVLAIAYQGRLVYERGFGYADLGGEKAEKVPVRPSSRFRIASISKPFTAVGVLRLVQSGKLRLDDKVYDLLKPEPLEGETLNERFKKVTILHLLQHRGGFSREGSFDPMFRSHIIAAAVGRDGPAEPEDIIRYMVSRKILHEPGHYYQYSNFGYCLLGRVIEKVSGKSYEAYMKGEILDPLGLDSMALGHSKEELRLTDEVKYYGQDYRKARSVFVPKEGLTVLWQYGGFYLEAMDSHGAWVSNARDLLRFVCDFDDPESSRLLSGASISTMFACPPGKAFRTRDGKPNPRFYACGWTIQRGKRYQTQDHGGSLPGTTAKLMRRSDRIHWVVLFNSRRDGARKERIHPDQIQGRMQRALSRVEAWPELDLFPAR